MAQLVKYESNPHGPIKSKKNIDTNWATFFRVGFRAVYKTRNSCGGYAISEGRRILIYIVLGNTANGMCCRSMRSIRNGNVSGYARTERRETQYALAKKCNLVQVGYTVTEGKYTESALIMSEP